MTETTISAQYIANFLRENPAFFSEHAEVFSTLHVPNPHGSRAISLGERQILTLRERNRMLERHLSELTHNALSNESIGERISQWCCRLLSETDPRQLPQTLTQGLREQFKLEQVALRLWNLSELPETGYSVAVSPDVRTFADSLKTPYCGSDTGFEAVGWLDTPPQSLALIALRLDNQAPSIGLLVLGSDNPERFNPELGTEFLQSIGRLASAALQRLHQGSDAAA